MSVRTTMEEQIVQELQRQRSLSLDDIVHQIESGQAEEAADRLVFFCAAGEFVSKVQALRDRLAKRFSLADRAFKKECTRFLCHLALDLDSFLVKWNLQRPYAEGYQALTEAEIRKEIDFTRRLLASWERGAPDIAQEALQEWRQAAVARFRAEKAREPESLAEGLTGKSLADYIGNMAEAFQRSHLRRVAEMRVSGLNHTELGNDYASFLKYTMYLGASFVTTNPVLVDIAWTDDPGHWDGVMKAAVASNPQAREEDLARLATLEVVLANMRLLRPIFLLTGGRMGSVSLQVNPKRHGDDASMIADAIALYEDLRQRLGGGVPNVVFKLPATLAGLRACRVLTQQGIGVNITVNFGLFQLLRFAEVIREGQAIYAVLSEMNGRLAFPVRDELLAKLPLLAAQGISEADAREAAAWSGVLVVKKLHRLLDEKGYDLQRIRPLVASLRIYKEGPGYDRLPSAYPDVTETVGTRIITVFPNVRHALDNEPNLDLQPLRLNEPAPAHILDVLAHSEIFRQAYYVADRRWVEEEDERFRPNQVLSLEDEAAVASWTPVYNTLQEFATSYDRFVSRLMALRA